MLCQNVIATTADPITKRSFHASSRGVARRIRPGKGSGIACPISGKAGASSIGFAIDAVTAAAIGVVIDVATDAATDAVIVAATVAAIGAAIGAVRDGPSKFIVNRKFARKITNYDLPYSSVCIAVCGRRAPPIN
jgi:hypothetical protein